MQVIDIKYQRYQITHKKLKYSKNKELLLMKLDSL